MRILDKMMIDKGKLRERLSFNYCTVNDQQGKTTIAKENRVSESVLYDSKSVT